MQLEEFESRFEAFWRKQPPGVVLLYERMLYEVYRRACVCQSKIVDGSVTSKQ
jgi:hypothetical protein